jgi:hypothetical protein
VKVDQDEIEHRWMAREPVEGVAFLLNDSVQVVTGPHSGLRGAVISLAKASPPAYVVELGDGREVHFGQADLVTATAEDPAGAIARLQRWYSSQCDGDWEHQLGVKVETLDNPGWLLKIDLRDTPLEARHFTEVRREDAREWLDCRVADAVFTGAGGPHMLGAIIEVFVRWAEAGAG